MSHSTREQDLAAKARFDADTTDHQMTVLHDDGLYRHLHFAPPGHGFYWFDVITWPGHLTLNGDMGTWTFARTEDMFEFFRNGRGLTRINPGYWAEKLVNGISGGNRAAEEYDGDYFVQLVNEHVEEYVSDWPAEAQAALRQEIEDEVLTDDYGNRPAATDHLAHDALERFRFQATADGRVCRFEFSDTWEWDLKQPTIHFLWSCWAIVHAIAAYDAAKAAEKERDSAWESSVQNGAKHHEKAVLAGAVGAL